MAMGLHRDEKRGSGGARGPRGLVMLGALTAVLGLGACEIALGLGDLRGSGSGAGGAGGAGSSATTSGKSVSSVSSGGAGGATTSVSSGSTGTAGPTICSATSGCPVVVKLSTAMVTTALGYTLTFCPSGPADSPSSCELELDLGETAQPLAASQEAADGGFADGGDIDGGPASPGTRQGTVSVRMLALPITYTVEQDAVPLVATITSEATCPPDIATGAGITDLPCSADVTGGMDGGASPIPGCTAGLAASAVTVTATPAVCCNSTSTTLCGVFAGMYVTDATDAIQSYVQQQLQAALTGVIEDQGCLHY